MVQLLNQFKQFQPNLDQLKSHGKSRPGLPVIVQPINYLFLYCFTHQFFIASWCVLFVKDQQGKVNGCGGGNGDDIWRGLYYSSAGNLVKQTASGSACSALQCLTREWTACLVQIKQINSTICGSTQPMPALKPTTCAVQIRIWLPCPCGDF